MRGASAELARQAEGLRGRVDHFLGAIRAAVMEEQPFLRGAAFEDELVRLALAYLQAITGTSAAAR